MKKIIALTFILALFAGSAFAASPTGSEYTTDITGSGDSGVVETISVLSNNVGARVVSNFAAFSATTAHVNGSKQYGTSSETTKIYSAAFEEGTTNLETPSTSDSTDFNSSPWSAL
jgi:uncharacterized membrane protein